MEYRSRVPGEPLEGVVALIFHLKGYRPEHSIERVVPDGSSTIVVELDGQTRWTVSNQTHQRLRAYRDAWLSGPHRNFFSITSLADTELIGIRFTETGLFSLLGRSVEEFTDRIVDAEPHLPHSPSTLRKGLVRATTSEEKFDLVESWLVRSSEPAVRPPRALRKAISICQNADQPIRWSRVASEVGYSQKTLIQVFKKYVGLLPSEYQRIRRFNRILESVHSSGPLNWGELSARHGYCDQPHFTENSKGFPG